MIERPSDTTLLFDLLAEPSTWADPRAGLEEDVLQAIAQAQPTHQRASRRRARLRVVMTSAAAAAVVAIIAGVVFARGSHGSVSYSAQLAATPLAPGARGAAGFSENDAGFEIVLNTTDLPTLREDAEYYQAWLKDEQGTAVAVGTFSASGDWVVLWSGVSPEEFSKMAITIEPANNDQESSGRVVLTGEVQPR